MAQLYRTRPSSLLDLADGYAAYCVDEAGAWLLAQTEPPDYGEKKPSMNRNAKVLEALKRMGGLTVVEEQSDV